MIKWSLYQYANLTCDNQCNSCKPEFGGKFLSLIRDMYKNPRANITFNGKILKAFPLVLRNIEDVCYDHIHWAFTGGPKLYSKKKKLQVIRIGKEETKLIICE